jgi:hypothetical protein
MSVVKLGRVPDKVRSIDELFGAVRQMSGVQHVVVIVEDEEGTTTMTVDGTTAERMNWMLDRAKYLLHDL